jgi:glycerol-3-phosphate dehydrogenase (NAD(P)+)
MAKASDTSIPYDHIGVIGGGAWGTALALVAAQAGRRTTLWARESAVVDSINDAHENPAFLPKVPLPAAIRATTDLAEAARAEALLLVIPAQHLRAVLARLTPYLAAATPLMLCAKGIERGTGLLLTEVLQAAAPAATPAILSGPSFARDVGLGLPTAITIAASDLAIAQRLQASLAHAQFRPYASDDPTGVALGGAAKNVYAIGCGIADGLGLGESARAALLARSFAELSGLGDLVLTASSPSSRNFAFGRKLGAGTPLATLTAPGMPLAEGFATAPALVARAARQDIELPIAETVATVLSGALPAAQALAKLMSRPLKPE